MAVEAAAGCEKAPQQPSGSLGTITITANVSDPRFDEKWQKLSSKDVDVFYIEDDHGEGLMGKVRRAARSVPEPSPPPAAPPPAGTGTTATPDVPSGEAVSNVIRSNLPNVKACYLRMTRAGRSVTGKAIVSFTVDKEGAVAGVKVDAPNFRETELPTCVTQQIQRWSFPKSGKGGLAVSYPFVFVSG